MSFHLSLGMDTITNNSYRLYSHDDIAFINRSLASLDLTEV